MRKIKKIVIHHSLTDDGKAKNWEAIRKYHKEHNGWSDIGYHYGIEQVGSAIQIQYGRGVELPGAHVKDMNKDTIGICVVGNYDKKPPSKDKLEVLKNVCTTLMRAFSLEPEDVIGHREAQALQGLPPSKRKSCPGLKFDMDSFRKELL